MSHHQTSLPLPVVVAIGFACGLVAPTASRASPTDVEDAAGSAAGAPVTVRNAEQCHLASQSGRTYRIFVSAPSGKAPAAGWPVLYVLDGNENFSVFASAVDFQAPDDPRAVVVGIGYPEEDRDARRARRYFDLTPATSEEWMRSLPTGGPTVETGGDDAFLAFIESELRPWVENRHRIDRTKQALGGHSLGGLFTLHVLFSRPGLFQTYLVSSPSLWWNDRSVLADERAFLKEHAEGRVEARVLITVGEWEQAPRPGSSAGRAALLAERRMVESARELASRLSAGGIEGLTVKFLAFAEEEHGSAVLPAASRGVRFLLGGR